MTQVQEAIRNLVREHSFLNNSEYAEFSSPLKQQLFEYITIQVDSRLGARQRKVVNMINNLPLVNARILDITNRSVAEHFIELDLEFLDFYYLFNITTTKVMDSIVNNLDIVNDSYFRLLMMDIIKIYFMVGVKIPEFIQQYIVEQEQLLR